MQQLTYGTFTEAVNQHTAGARAALDVTIELTRRCPLTCLHCYNNLPMGDIGAKNHELTLDEHKKLLDELAATGVVWLLYTGGEIFARKDFFDIYIYAKQKGFLITLFTNGILIDEEVADKLALWRPLGIEITLYGHTEETYEKLTGVPGSFARCRNGVKLLMERNLPLVLKTVPTKINWHEVYDMKRFAEEEMGVKFKYDPLVNPRIDCSQSPLEIRLSPEEVVALELQDPKRSGAMRDAAMEELLRDQSDAVRLGNPVYTCGGGHNSCSIDPYGNMSICVISHGQQYSWRGGNFREGWDGFMAQQRERRRVKRTKCTECRLHTLCAMCPANGELENGDPEKPVEFLCHVAHLRAKTLGIDSPEHGECEFCNGGIHEAIVAQEAARLQDHTTAIEPWMPPSSPFQILNQASANGCGSCGSHS